VVDYSLKSEIKTEDEKEEPAGGRKKTPVKIVVTDAQGKPVATRYGESKQGLNRYVWDMRYDGEKDLTFQKKPPANEFFTRGEGPRVLPGEYRVAVTVNGATQTVTARVGPDPRMPHDAEKARRGVLAALQARNELTALNEALNRAHDAREDLKKLERLSRRDEDGGKARFPQTDAAARALEKKITAFMDSMYNPDRQYDVGQDSIHYHSRFHDEMASLAGGLESTFDEAPTEVTEREIKRLRQELDSRLAEWNHIAAEDIPAYNKTAASEGAPTIYAGDPVRIEPAG
jgi:hypothetical protein